MKFADIKNLFGFVAIAFLPVGYFITILQQSIYLSCKRLGLHRKAKNEAKFKFPGNPDSELALEVFSTLSAGNAGITIERHKYFQEFIRKRMDVLVINTSLLTATGILGLCTFVLLLNEKAQFMKWKYLCSLLSFNLLILIILFWNTRLLRKQISLMLKEIYIKSVVSS